MTSSLLWCQKWVMLLTNRQTNKHYRKHNLVTDNAWMNEWMQRWRKEGRKKHVLNGLSELTTNCTSQSSPWGEVVKPQQGVWMWFLRPGFDYQYKIGVYSLWHWLTAEDDPQWLESFVIKLALKSTSRDNWCTVGRDGGCRVGEVQASTTSPMPDHKGFKLQ